jgi:hypothetical protein
MSETKYNVVVDFKANDHATKIIDNIGKSSERTAKSTGSLSSSLMGLGGAVAGSRLLGMAKTALIGFNSSLEDSRTVMAGMLQMNVGGNWEKNMDRATASVDRFQQMAKTSALTTKDLVGMAQMIEGPLLQAGAGMKSIEDLTFGAANAAKAFQIPAEMAALDIQQAINGTLSSKDRFAQSLLAQKGVGISSDSFNKKSSGERLDILGKALKSDAISKMAESQSNTMTGVVSTLQDNIEMALGKVGLPLFKAITKEIEGWNAWFDANQNKVNQFATSFAQGLAKAFEHVKSAISFIVDHADTLLMIGKVWAAIKIGQAAGGMLGSLGGAVGGLGKLGGKAGMGDAGTLMAVGTGSYTIATEVFKELGVTGALHEAILDKTSLRMEQLGKSMSIFDAAVLKSKDALSGEKGAKGTNTYATMVGANDVYKLKLKALEDSKRKDGSYGGAGFKNRLVAAGYDGDEVSKLNRDEGSATGLAMAEKLRANISRLDQQASDASIITDKRIEEVLSTMSGNQKSAVDIAKATQDVMMAMNASLAAGNGPLNYVQVKDMLMAGLDPDVANANTRPNAKPNSTNIHIAKVEVPAKDPDRWIAELDAKVNKQIKAPKSAKRGLRGGL